MRQRSRHPIIFKGSASQDVFSIAREIRGKASAIELNSVPWKMCFPDKPNPLARFKGGGVSGRNAATVNWPILRKLVLQGDLPVIGSNVSDFGDVCYLLEDIRVDAVSFGVIHMPMWDPRTWGNPAKPTRYVCRYTRREM